MHSRTVCSCGVMLTQCRCPSKDKVTIVSTKPCPHKKAATPEKTHPTLDDHPNP